LRLKPFLRIDSAEPTIIIDKLINSLNLTDHTPLKRQFINRSEEISSLQDYLYDDEIKFISVIGFFGMGKSSLIKEALKRTFSNSEYIEINLSPAHFGARLTLELCSKAGVEIPNDGASQIELDNLNLLAIETLLSKNKFVIFNKMETVLDDSGKMSEDIVKVIDYFKDKELLNKYPFIMLSTRWPDLKSIEKKYLGILSLKGLSNNHLNQIIQSEIERIDPKYVINKNSLHKLSNLLHGYPLAGRLASPFVLKYGVEYLVDNMRVINQLKIDVAEEIISKVKLDNNEINILEILAIFEKPLHASDIEEIVCIDSDLFNSCIDNLVSFNLIETEGMGLYLHPLVNDFYLKRARTSAKFTAYSEQLAEISKRHLYKIQPTNQLYVYWLTNACRL